MLYSRKLIIIFLAFVLLVSLPVESYGVVHNDGSRTVYLYLQTTAYGQILATSKDFTGQQLTDITNETSFYSLMPFASSLTVREFEIELWLKADRPTVGYVTVQVYEFFSREVKTEILSYRTIVNFSSPELVHSIKISERKTYTFSKWAYIEFKVSFSAPQQRGVYLLWGDEQTPSKLTLICEPYDIIDWIKTTNVNGTETSKFNVNWTAGKNRVWIHVSVTDPLGGYDIKNPLLTIIGPDGSPVVSNQTMFLTSGGPYAETSIYSYKWDYDQNSTVGEYKVHIYVSDMSGNTFFRSASFKLYQELKPPEPVKKEEDSSAYIAMVAIASAMGFLAAVFAVFLRPVKMPLGSVLDYVLYGGIELPSSIMVVGNPGSGKRRLLKHCLKQEAEKRSCVYIALTEFPRTIKEYLKELGVKPDALRRVNFIDGYSPTANITAKNDYVLASPTDLTNLDVKLSTLMDKCKGGVSVFLDSLSPIAMKLKPDTITMFIHSISAKIKGKGGNFYFAVSSDTAKELLAKLQEVADYIIELRRGRRGCYLRVKKGPKIRTYSKFKYTLKSGFIEFMVRKHLAEKILKETKSQDS